MSSEANTSSKTVINITSSLEKDAESTNSLLKNTVEENAKKFGATEKNVEMVDDGDKKIILKSDKGDENMTDSQKTKKKNNDYLNGK